MEYLEFSETIIYRYDPGNFRYEYSETTSIDPTTNQPRNVAYSTTIKPLIEPSFGEALYFIDNEWVIRDEYVNGVFYKKSDGGMEEKVKVKDLDLYTEIQPMLPIKEGDQIGFIDGEWAYTYRVPPTIEDFKEFKIYELKNEGSRRIQTIDGRYYDNISWLRKSQNYQDIISMLLPKHILSLISDEENNLLKNAQDIINRKNRYVQRINEVESRILSMESIDQINEVDVMNDELWSGLDG